MSSRVAGRLERLRSHLEAEAGSDIDESLPLGRHPTWSGSGDWHQQCFSFEPGRLLLNQVSARSKATSSPLGSQRALDSVA